MQDFIANIDNLSHKYSKDWAIRNISFNIAKKRYSRSFGIQWSRKINYYEHPLWVINQTDGSAYIDGINVRENPS